MKAEFANYLQALEVPHALVQRIEEIYLIYKDLCTDEITDIFVTDYIDESKERRYENLWFFTHTSYAMEAKGFAANYSFDMMNLRERILRWEIKKQDYDFRKATAQSRLVLDVSVFPSLACRFKAAGNNCDYLKAIFLKYFHSNLGH